MGENSAIGWTNHTFNPWTGCTKVSPACQNCYAEAWAKRSGIVKWGDSAERRRTSASNWRLPLKWNKAALIAGTRRKVFCASLADVFEDRDELKPWRKDLFQVIAATRQLDWLLLTKRPENILRMMNEAAGGLSYDLRSHLWLGTTVESQAQSRRIDHLVNCRQWSSVLFLSCEPLLGPLSLFNWLHAVDETRSFDYNMGINWVIVGGESGPKHRPLNLDHARGLRDECLSASVPYFFKQHGGNRPESNGCELDGREWKQFPRVA